MYVDLIEDIYMRRAELEELQLELDLWDELDEIEAEMALLEEKGDDDYA